ncbi:MAG: PAS domain-containing protein [Kofleriaceae bacterium]|nr:PAS domain-containing protein [Kofleriaceae bacterium]MCB9574463.1 PAS domain-containing protein [Kofleriaceae bacterium]
MVEAASDGMFVTDAAFRIDWVNDAACAMLGRSPAQLVGTTIAALLDPEELARAPLRRHDLLAGRATMTTRTFVLPDGERRILEVSATRIAGDRLLGLARDVTAQRRMTAQLTQADRLASLGTLAAGVAHEINNPLTYVLLHLDALAALAGASTSPLAPEVADHAATATSGVRRVAAIVRDLRAFSRGGDDDLGPVDVHGALELALSTAGHELRHRAMVERRYREVPTVLASEGRLAQIFVNLLINAAQALPDGQPDDHRVVVATTATGGEVHVAITDTGTGIDEAHRRRIFEPFFTTRSVGVGTGLGLSICHGLVVALGGRIDVDTAPGRGSTFTVTLPAFVAATAAPPAPAPAPTAAAAARRLRLLFVDDEPAIGQVVARAFADTHEVVLAASGGDARELLARDPDFDVVVCDLVMPGIGGLQLHAWLRQAHPALAARLVFVSGGRIGDGGDAATALADQPVLDKPFTLDALEAAIAAIAVAPRR